MVHGNPPGALSREVANGLATVRECSPWCQTGITLKTGASINGRLLAQTAVNIDSSTVVQPAP